MGKRIKERGKGSGDGEKGERRQMIGEGKRGGERAKVMKGARSEDFLIISIASRETFFFFSNSN